MKKEIFSCLHNHFIEITCLSWGICKLSLVKENFKFIFLSTTNQAKSFTWKKAFDFQLSFVRQKLVDSPSKNEKKDLKENVFKISRSTSPTRMIGD